MKKHRMKHNDNIGDLLQQVIQWEKLFAKYLSTCASTISPDQFCQFVLSFISAIDVNETILTHMISVLKQRNKSLSIEQFIERMNWGINTQTTVNDTKTSSLKKVLETIFDGFVTRDGHRTSFSVLYCPVVLSCLLDLYCLSCPAH